MAQRTDSKVTIQEALQDGLKKTTNCAAIKCLHYVLEQGADVHHLSPHWLLSSEITSTSMREVLEILVARGFDINSESRGLPVLWYVGVGDHDHVKWCLDQGAKVDPPDQTSTEKCRPREPILEQAAVVGDINPFELLRSKGAPLDRKFGVFPKAVMAANDCVSDALEPSARLKEKIRMLTHLLEVVGCDVNSNCRGPHYGSGSLCSTPLCWIACHPRGSNVKVLIWLLLNHGGDLDRTLEYTDQDNKLVVVHSARDAANGISGRGIPNQQFLEAVREWETEH